LGASYFTAVATANNVQRRILVTQAIKSAVILSTAVSLGLAALAPAVIPVFFGDEFVGAVPAAIVAIFSSVAIVTGFVVSNSLAAQGRGLTMTFAQLGAAVVGVGLLVIWGSAWGAVGAAAASAIAYAVASTVMILALRPLPGLWRINHADFAIAVTDLLRGRKS